MGQLSRKLRDVQGSGLKFWCPGCNDNHGIYVGPGGWTWNRDVDRPVFGPSILVTSGHFVKGHVGPCCWCTYNAARPDKRVSFTCYRCHSFVGCNGAAPGQITFLSDCTHALAGQTVDLPDWPRAHFPHHPERLP